MLGKRPQPSPVTSVKSTEAETSPKKPPEPAGKVSKKNASKVKKQADAEIDQEVIRQGHNAALAN